MTDASKREEPEDLSVPEKILRVQDLWDDIALLALDAVVSRLRRLPEGHEIVALRTRTLPNDSMQPTELRAAAVAGRRHAEQHGNT